MATTTAAVSVTPPSSLLHQPAHRGFGVHGGPVTSTIVGGGRNFHQHQPPFIPLSVVNPVDELQTVPCGADVSRVDTHKLQRKRERNRVAAQKCRQRKVEQISVLQERVELLNRTKVELERTADQLRRQVDLLQRHIRQHINAGCQLARRPPVFALPAGL